jgi:dephospho-CoA kinase
VPNSGSTRLVALTGGIGSGKSTAAAAFLAEGIPTLDVDEVSRSLTAAGGAALAPIEAAFGATLVDASGALDRAKMRQLVFSDAVAKQRLEAILHPMIKAASDHWLETVAGTVPLAALEIPLLFEGMSYRHRLWCTVAVDCPTRLQVERVTQRSGLGSEDVRRIIAAQLPRHVRLQLADFVVPNVKSAAEFDALARALARHLLRTVCD